MRFVHNSTTGVILVEPDIHEDERGFFFESYQKQTFETAGIPSDFVQENYSGSKQGVLRGLHYQVRQTQGKLIQVTKGKIFDVCVDLRRKSPTFGKWFSFHLDAEKRISLWLPPGFAHGFYVLSNWMEIHYKVTDYYTPEWERTLRWNDPAVGIKWPFINNEHPFLSSNDTRGVSLAEVELVD